MANKIINNALSEEENYIVSKLIAHICQRLKLREETRIDFDNSLMMVILAKNISGSIKGKVKINNEDYVIEITKKTDTVSMDYICKENEFKL